MTADYRLFLNSACGTIWKKIGARRRAGVTVPLFSLYSAKSIGIGEAPDLKLLIDWCQKTGLSIIQLLPLNDVGFDFRPYDAQSSIALDPMYLSIEGLAACDLKPFVSHLKSLRQKFPTGKARVDYGVKKAKLELLHAIFEGLEAPQKEKAFAAYLKANKAWLDDYAVFKALKEKFQMSGWMDWPEEFRTKQPQAVASFSKKNPKEILFHQWLQWQLFEQFRKVKQYAAKAGVLLMGDIPFLVSRDSADVWADQACFQLDLSSGAPSDLYFAKGQRWGMPPYDWGKIEADGFKYLSRKLEYAEHLFDLYRIDHFVGMFRLWTIRLSEPEESGGAQGCFDPADKSLWKDHGKKILEAMLRCAKMLPCAEDLGSVPKCSYEVLDEYKIPGSDVQRWVRNWEKDYRFKSGDAYRAHSMAMLSTHDTSAFCTWWEYEAGTVDECFFRKKCEGCGVPFDDLKEKLFDLPRSQYGRLRWHPEIENVEKLLAVLGKNREEAWHLVDAYLSAFEERQFYWQHVGMEGPVERRASLEFVRKVLESVNQTRSVFSLQILQDWLSVGTFEGREEWEYRINVPGSMGDRNWSLVAPFSLEALQKLPVNKAIRKIVIDSGRLVPVK